MGKKNEDAATVALQAAITEAKAVVSLRKQIAEAITRTKANIQSIGADRQAALKAVEIEEADIAMAEADGALAGKQSTRAERHAQRQLEEVDRNEALLASRVCGLEARLAQTDDRLLAAEDTLKVARRAWNSARVAEYAAELEKASEPFGKLVMRGIALTTALGRDARADELKRIAIPDVTDAGDKKLFDGDGQKRNVETGQWYAAWRDDPDAASVFEAHSEPRELEKSLARETVPVRAAKAKAAADALAAKSAAERAAGPQTQQFERYVPPPDGSGTTTGAAPAYAIPPADKSFGVGFSVKPGV